MSPICGTFDTSKKKTDKPQFVVGDYPHLPCINVKDLHYLRPVGTGNQAIVYKVHTKMLGTCSYKEFSRPIELTEFDGERANPCVSPSTEGEKKYLIRELTYSLEVNCHPNIIVVHAYASEFDGENLPIKHKGILMEFMESGPLSKYLYSFNKNSENWDWEEPELQIRDANAWPRLVDKWALQIARALAFCHDAFKLIHRDVKPQNILLSADFETAKLSDFGIARRSRKSDGPMTSGKGTQTYMAPEVYIFGSATADYSFSADVFSYGCLLYAMTTKKGPFDQKAIELKSKTVFFDYLKNDKNRPPLSKNPEYAKLNDIIKKCWKTNPKERPTMEKIVRDLDQCVRN